jgi:tRNA pseudouridine38-40 synthase
MRHIRLVVQYDGTGYAGFQVQPNCPTVQGALEQALGRLLNESIRITGASRTDAGVHAYGQVVTFTTENVIPLERIVPALNAVLPADVATTSAEEVPADFHPRFGALDKEYLYRILNRALPSPFLGRYAWHLKQPLDVTAMESAAQVLVGEHDFAAFCAAGGAAKTTVRELYEVSLQRNDEVIECRFGGNSFLYMMVRIMVGTLVEVGLGRLATDDVRGILQSGDRNQAGPTAPPQGLTLIEIQYPASGTGDQGSQRGPAAGAPD